MALKLNSSGGGSVTLDAPVTANNYTLTAPASSGTLATTDGGNTTFTSITDSGNLTFTGTGNRITGDFSNATVANRVMFQTSTSNDSTFVSIIPNGTGQTTGVSLYTSSSDQANSSLCGLLLTSSEFNLRSTRTGTGTYLPMIFSTGGSERMRLDTSGNVGIGTSSPVAGSKLDVYTNTTGDATVTVRNGYSGAAYASNIKLDAANVTGSYYNGLVSYSNGTLSWAIKGNGSASTICFNTGSADTERMRIDSSGNVMIGLSAASSLLHIGGGGINGGVYIEDQNATSASPVYRVRGNRYDTNGSQSFSGGLVLERYMSSGASGIVSGNVLGTIYFGGNYNSTGSFTYPASISAIADANWTATNAAATAIAFFTGSTGQALSTANVAFGTERMRIDSGGIVYIGGTSGYGTTPTGLGVKSTSTNWQVISLAQPNASAGCVINYVTPSTTGVGWDAGAANGSSAWMFRYNASQISNINSSTGVYTATSDVNRKKDFEESSIGLAEVMRLKPTLFRMLVDDESSEKELGFIAQDVKSVIPQAYVEDGDFIGLQDRPIIAALTKAIQEQQEQINQLKAEIAALKGA